MPLGPPAACPSGGCKDDQEVKLRPVVGRRRDQIASGRTRLAFLRRRSSPGKARSRERPALGEPPAQSGRRYRRIGSGSSPHRRARFPPWCSAGPRAQRTLSGSSNKWPDPGVTPDVLFQTVEDGGKLDILEQIQLKDSTARWRCCPSGQKTGTLCRRTVYAASLYSAALEFSTHP